MKRELKIAGIVFAGSLVVLAGFLWMPLFLAGPDGLEQVLFDLSGNDEYEPNNPINYEGALFPDYEFSLIPNSYLASWLVGLIGAILCAGVMFGLLKMIKITRSRKIISNTASYD